VLGLPPRVALCFAVDHAVEPRQDAELRRRLGVGLAPLPLSEPPGVWQSSHTMKLRHLLPGGGGDDVASDPLRLAFPPRPGGR